VATGYELLTLNSKLVSAIIVNYNGGKFVLDCADSVLRSAYPSVEVLIVDNSSTDGSLRGIEEKFEKDERVRVIKNSRNSGYAAAINLGVKAANGDYLAILNNDTAPHADWLNRPVELMEEDRSVGAVQPVLFYYDRPRVINDAGHFIDEFAVVYSRNHLPDRDPSLNAEDEIFAATGAAMIVRKTTFEEIGGFDSDFFLLFEETDFCWRVWLSGQRVVLVPKSGVYHRARGSYRLAYKTSYLFNRNRICSMLKNSETRYAVRNIPANFLIIIGTGLYQLTRSNSKVLLENMNAILWNMTNLRLTLQKRRRVDQLRKVSEARLVSRGVIRRSSLPALLRRLVEKQ
jgi:GT2 family glycosyltransferase